MDNILLSLFNSLIIFHLIITLLVVCKTVHFVRTFLIKRRCRIHYFVYFDRYAVWGSTSSHKGEEHMRLQNILSLSIVVLAGVDFFFCLMKMIVFPS